LKEYDLRIEYCPGQDNIIDALSRHPVGRDEGPPDIMPSILRMKILVPPKLPPELIRSGSRTDLWGGPSNIINKVYQGVIC